MRRKKAPTAAQKRKQKKIRRNDTQELENATQSENMALTVAMPKASFTEKALQNLQNLIDAKEILIKKALAIGSLPIEVNDEKISFPWFQDVRDGKTIDAYTHFITALCGMAKKQSGITTKEKSPDNENFAFRYFPLRLGFIRSAMQNCKKNST